MKNKWNDIINLQMIEYQQIREDIRHSNTIFYYTFYIVAIVLGLLLNIIYQIATEQNIYPSQRQILLISLGVVGLTIIGFALFINYSTYRTIELAIEDAKELNKKTFLNKIEYKYKIVLYCCMVIVIISIICWVGFIYIMFHL